MLISFASAYSDKNRQAFRPQSRRRFRFKPCQILNVMDRPIPARQG